MVLPGLFVDQGSLCTDGRRLAAVALLRCDEPDGAVPVFMDVPVDKRRSPLACSSWLANGLLG